MKKSTIIILIVLGLIIGLSIYLALKPEKPFNKIELQNTSYVVNTTKVPYLDTIVKVGLAQLKIKGVTVIINTLPLDFKTKFKDENNLDLQAFITGKGNQYSLWIGENTREGNISIISHELIHLTQYYQNRFKELNDRVIYNGDTLVDIPPYKERPWEIEAFTKGPILAKQINEILYE